MIFPFWVGSFEDVCPRSGATSAELLLGGSAPRTGPGYVVNLPMVIVGKSPKDRVVGLLPYMAMNMAYKWG